MKFEERSKLHAKNEEERIQKDASKMSHSLFPGKLAGSTLGKKKTKKKKAKGLGEKVYREKEPEMPFFKNKQTISSIVTTPLPPFVRPLPNSFSPAFDTTPRLRKSLRIIKALNHHHCLERELLESELITSASNPLSFPPSLSFLNAVSAKVYQDMSPHNKEGSDKAGDSLDQRPASVDWSDRRYDFLWHTETLRKKPVRAHRDKFYFREDRNLSRKQYLSEHRRSPLHLAAMHASDIRNEQREKESIGYYEHSYLPVEAVLPTALKQNRGVSHANNQADQQASNRQDGSIVRLRSTRYFDTLKQLLDLLKKVGASASGLNLFAYDECK